MTWEQQENGSFLGAASERAVDYAAGDNDKLAAVCFAAFLQASGIPFTWTLDEPLIVRAGIDVIGVRADSGCDAETFTIEDSLEMWTLAARILHGSPPLVLLVGLTAVMGQQLDHFGPALPRRAFLRVSEWLTQFNVIDDRKDIAA